MRLRLCAGLVLAIALGAAAPAAYAQTADPPRNLSVNFVTGAASWQRNSGDCNNEYSPRWRTSPTAGWTSGSSRSGTSHTVSALANPNYGEYGLTGNSDSGCPNPSAEVRVSFTATTLSSSPGRLSNANLNGARLTVSLGDDETSRSSATSPETFVAAAAASHFTLNTTAITGLVVGAVAVTTGGRTAAITLSHAGGDVGPNATITVSVAAAAHSGSNALTSKSVPVFGLQIDTDTSTPTTADPGPIALAEGDSQNYAVRLRDAPSGSVTMTVTSSDADAVTVDTSTASGLQSTLTFTTANWGTYQTVTAAAVQDTNATNESVTITHATNGGGYNGLSKGLVVTVEDDEVAEVLVDAAPGTAAVDDGPLLLHETSATSGNYTVTLAGVPAQTVTVAVASDNPAVTLSASTLTFTTANWNTAQTVTVSTTADADAVDEAADVTHTASGAAYDGVVATLRVGVADAERAGTDYDTDEDGLIEVNSLAQLNAVRWDLNGDGAVASGDQADYATAFPDASAGMGCPDGDDADQTPDACRGYELMRDLDFDTDGDGSTHTAGTGDSGDAYYDGNTGWCPIGCRTRVRLGVTQPLLAVPYTATFDGNGKVIYNLFTRYNANDVGLFAELGDGTVAANITSVGLAQAYIGRGQSQTGALVGDLHANSRVAASWSSGSVIGNSDVGGLVGRNQGEVVASYTRAAVSSRSPNGQSNAGLVGNNPGAIRTGYSVGTVTGGASRAAFSTGSGTVVASYWDATLSSIADDNDVVPPEGRTTTLLQTPTEYGTTGLYAAWDDQDVDGDGVAGQTRDDAWDFGTNAQHPVLKYAGFDTARQFNSQGTDSSPSFGTGSVTNKTYQKDEAIAQFQVPAATGGNGAISYTVTGLPAGLEFDADGSGTCGTARAVCGTPTTNVASTTVTVTADDHDDNTADQDTLTFTVAVVTPAASISATNPAALTEGNLNNATVTVTLADTTFGSGVTATSFTLGGTVPGVMVASVGTVSSGATTATLTLSYSGANFDDVRTLSVTVAAAAHALSGSLTTATVNVTPTRSVALSPLVLSVNEGDSETYAVALGSVPTGPVTVAITGAQDGVSADPTSLSFTASNWNTAQTVTVGAAADANMVNETVTLAHAASGADYGSVSADLVVTAVDSDAPSLHVHPTTLTLAEGSSGTYAISLNTQPSASVTVTVGGTTTDVTVDTDSDTTGDQNTLTFTTANWDTSQTVTVSAGNDDDATDDMVGLTHAATGGDYTSLVLAARPGVAVTVTDDDTPAILIDADPTTPNMDEAGPLALNELAGDPDKTKNYSVRLATEPTQTVTVAITSGDGAVTVGTSSLTFTTANWDTAQTVTATAAEDDDASDEQVAIAHAASGGDYAGVSAELIATTVDDDVPALTVAATALTTSGVTEGATATYTVQLATEPDGIAVVSVSVSGGSVSVDMDGQQAGLQSSLAFDATTWNMPQTVIVRGLEDDDAMAGMATLRHTASGADYGQAQAVEVGPFAVADDDIPAVTVAPTTVGVNEGSTATYTVVLATAPVGGPVTITVASSDIAVATASPGTLTFSAGNWNMPRQVTVAGVADADTTAGSATITHTVSGADYGSVVAAPVTVTAYDIDGDSVRIEPLRLTVREGESATYRVRLNTQPTGDVTVTETSGSTALAIDSDGTPQTLALTFTTANWNTEQTVTVEAASDDDADDLATSISHGVTGYGTVNTAPLLTVSVEDDDAAGLMFDPAFGLTLTEGGGAAATGSYTVVLTSEPTASVTLALSSDDAGLAFDADGATQGDQTSMTFTTANWNTAQTVTVRAEADGDAASETATLLHAASGGGYDDVSVGYAIALSDADAAAAPGGVSAASAGPTSLTVTWTASANAQSYLVLWRRSGEAWSTGRQLAVTGTTVRIDGLQTGTRYEVRVFGVNRGAPGEPSAIAVATPLADVTQENRAPEPVGELADISLAIGETQTVDISAAFVDPDGDALTYTAWSLDESVATASALSGGQLRVRGEDVGVATVMVRVMDPDGLTATRQLRATVGVTLSLAANAEAPEGGTVRLVATLSTSRATATTFAWRVAADMDAATADADVGEHGGASGEATIAAGETTAEIAIAIADDADIEPAREWFDVVLEAPADGCCVVREARARVAVLEGVCDRTPAVADALRRDAACTAPTPATLATRTRLTVAGAEALGTGDFQGLPNLRWLVLSGNDLATLPEDVFAGLGLLRELDLSGNALTTLSPAPFSGLSRLRLLDLSGNAFETLPAGLFAGLFLREASLEENPGAPFPLAAELTRTDAEPSAAGPATVEVRLPSGAPFPLRLPLTAEPAQETLPAMVAIPSGATAAAPFAASAPAASARVLRVGAATLPAATCGDEWPFRACFRGLAPQPSATLTLFRQPPRALPAPELEPLAGDALQLPLASLIAAGDGALRWQASSSDEAVATVRVVGGNLLVEPELGAEGTTEIVLVATDAVGLTATVRFTVQVEFFARTRVNVGWRTAIGNVAPQ